MVNFKAVIVDGEYLPPEKPYDGGCRVDDENCEDIIRFEFPAFNLLFLLLYLILLTIQGMFKIIK